MRDAAELFGRADLLIKVKEPQADERAMLREDQVLFTYLHLAPISEVAGRLAVQAGAHCLERVHGGRGMLPDGIPGVEPDKVGIIGGGMVGTHSAAMALGIGADTWGIDHSSKALRNIWRQFGQSAKTVYSTSAALTEHVCSADLVIGSVLVPGAAAPKLVTREMIEAMRPGSVIVDVAIDQGGYFETSRSTIAWRMCRALPPSL